MRECLSRKSHSFAKKVFCIEKIAQAMKNMKVSSTLCMSLLATPVLVQSVHALEFGTMGNVSASMGGAGVALKSPFGLYYNPALIVADDKSRFGYSISAGVEQSNLDKLTNINFNKLVRSLSSLGDQMSGGSSWKRSNGVPGGNVNTRAATNLQSSLVEALQNVNGSSETDLAKLWEEYQNRHPGSDHSGLANAIQSAVNGSSMSQDQKDMFNDLAGSVDWSNFEVAADGKITQMTIKAGSNGALDSALEDLNVLFEVLRNNNMNVKSQNGLVFQLSSKVLQEKFGSIAVGFFTHTQAGLSLAGDASRMRLIFGDTNGYYELILNGDSYVLKQATKDDYDKYSILQSTLDGNAHKIVSSIFNLIEIPVGYAYNFRFGKSNLSLGVALKAMLGSSLYYEQYIGTNLSFNTNFTNNAQHAGALGVDLGMYYGYDVGEKHQISAGVVVKNVNSPTFRFSTAPTVVIKPQYRAGIAYNGHRLSVAFDADLVANEMLNYSVAPKLSQMVGGGIKFDYKHIDFRAGVAYDIRQDSGAIITAGINILGFIDIAAEVGTKWVDYFGVTAPKYANVRLGGSFSW